MGMAEELTEQIVPVLFWVNSVRWKLGLPPLEQLPCGITESATRCVIANAFRDLCHVNVDQQFIAFDMPIPRWVIPPEVSKFIRDFDDGKYPFLIERTI